MAERQMKVVAHARPLTDVLLTGLSIVDPTQGPTEGDILIIDGKVADIGPGLDRSGREVVSADGLVAIPALVDLHTHLREPGEEWKEDITSGSQAAAAGGFGVVCAMPNTHPPADDEQVIRFVLDRGRQAGLIDVRPLGTISKGRAGKELAPIGELITAGAVGISDDGSPVSNSELMRCALQYARMFGIPVIDHCEDLDLSSDGQMNLGYASSVLGLRGIPAAAEEMMVARDLALARLTGGHLHVAHVSTAGSVAHIRAARAQGVRVTAEVTPHHLVLDDDFLLERPYDTSTKVNPPLRSQADVQALWEGLADGTIDAVATDHAPHHTDDKAVEYRAAASGISGLETAWPVLYTHGVKTGRLSLTRAVAAASSVPAGIVGIAAGQLKVGEVVGICIFDPSSEREVDPDAFLSRGKNTPFAGMRLAGWPVATIVGGRLVASRGELGRLEHLAWDGQ